MLTLICFLLTLAGSINWLMIGLLQYDYVAGIFGYQGSVFSRLIYIIIGVSAFYLIFKTFSDKGKINLINFKFTSKKKNTPAKIETADEFIRDKQNYIQNDAKIYNKNEKKSIPFEKKVTDENSIETYNNSNDEYYFSTDVRKNSQNSIFDDM